MTTADAIASAIVAIDIGKYKCVAGEYLAATGKASIYPQVIDDQGETRFEKNLPADPAELFGPAEADRAAKIAAQRTNHSDAASNEVLSSNRSARLRRRRWQSVARGVVVT